MVATAASAGKQGKSQMGLEKRHSLMSGLLSCQVPVLGYHLLLLKFLSQECSGRSRVGVQPQECFHICHTACGLSGRPTYGSARLTAALGKTLKPSVRATTTVVAAGVVLPTGPLESYGPG